MRVVFFRSCVSGERTCESLAAPSVRGGTVTQSCAIGRQDRGTICRFACNDTRYLLEGDSTTFCMENGEWSSPVPDCIGDEMIAKELF